MSAGPIIGLGDFLKPRPGCCEEAALGVVSVYMPCNKPAVNIVGWKGRSDPPIRMCFACTDHNVRHRGGEIIRPFVAEESNVTLQKENPHAG